MILPSAVILSFLIAVVRGGKISSIKDLRFKGVFFLAGAVFLGVVIVSKTVGALKDYRQKLLNTRVMLTLRRSLYDRLLHLPLPKLWEMKTGGILSRLSGDIDTTTGLLQMAVVSPALSAVRLAIAVGVLLALNWRLALMAVAVIPGAVLLSFVFARRVRPIYRSVRKDVEVIDAQGALLLPGLVDIRPNPRRRRRGSRRSPRQARLPAAQPVSDSPWTQHPRRRR
jgi:ATP-binding cassette subfamily B protein/subfamily B ATP-binding cassette protein MsbA